MRGFKAIFSAIPIVIVLAASNATAGPATDALSACMADNTTGKERKALARWIVIAISAHPEMMDIANVSGKVREESEHATANVVTKLLTESCLVQAKGAMQHEGSLAIQNSFEVVGKLAMQELLSNKEVISSITGFEKYIDKNKFESAFSSK